MLVMYELCVDLEPSEVTDLDAIMNNMADAIHRAVQEGTITEPDDTDTVIGDITLNYSLDKQPDPTQ